MCYVQRVQIVLNKQVEAVFCVDAFNRLIYRRIRFQTSIFRFVAKLDTVNACIRCIILYAVIDIFVQSVFRCVQATVANDCRFSHTQIQNPVVLQNRLRNADLRQVVDKRFGFGNRLCRTVHQAVALREVNGHTYAAVQAVLLQVRQILTDIILHAVDFVRTVAVTAVRVEIKLVGVLGIIRRVGYGRIAAFPAAAIVLTDCCLNDLFQRRIFVYAPNLIQRRSRTEMPIQYNRALAVFFSRLTVFCKPIREEVVRFRSKLFHNHAVRYVIQSVNNLYGSRVISCFHTHNYSVLLRSIKVCSTERYVGIFARVAGNSLETKYAVLTRTQGVMQHIRSANQQPFPVVNRLTVVILRIKLALPRRQARQYHQAVFLAVLVIHRLVIIVGKEGYGRHILTRKVEDYVVVKAITAVAVQRQVRLIYRTHNAALVVRTRIMRAVANAAII